MATAAETTQILQIVVGMVGAAPGADILKELEDIVDSGVTVEELALAISVNPLYNGDEGVYPDFFPDAIFAENFITNLLGDEVTEEVLEASIDAFAATLNADTSRGQAIYDAIIGLTETEDDDLADAQSAFANKVEVAEYYSVTLGRSSADLEELVAVVSGVASGDDGVDDGIDAVDSLIVGATELSGLLGNLDAANQAITDYLKAIKAPSTDAIEALEAAAAAGVEAAGATGFSAAGENTRPGLIADTEVALAKATSTAGKGVTAATTGTDTVTGLTTAVGVMVAATTAQTVATKNSNIASNTFASAILEYNGAKAGQAAAGAPAAGTAITTITDGGSIIVTGTSGLKLATGVSDVTNPGVSDLLAAAKAHNVVVDALDTADTLLDDATKVVENLDLIDGGARETALTALSAEMDLTSQATAAQIKAQFIARPELLTEANAAAVAELADGGDFGGVDLDAAIALIDTSANGLSAVAFDTDEATTEAAAAAVTSAAVTAGLLTSAEATLINDAFNTAQGVDGTTTAAAIAAAQGVLATENASAKDAAFTIVYDAYQLESIANTSLASVPLSSALITASLGVAAAAQAQADFAAAVAKWEPLDGAETTIADLEKAVTAAKADITEKGVEKMVDADGTQVGGTDDELFLAVDEDANIINFADADLLYIGAGLTLNEDDTAGDEGDNAVLEYWVTTSGGNTVITVEKTEFGSEAAEPETFAITLTGIAEDDIAIADGVVSLV